MYLQHSVWESINNEYDCSIYPLIKLVYSLDVKRFFRKIQFLFIPKIYIAADIACVKFPEPAEGK